MSEDQFQLLIDEVLHTEDLHESTSCQNKPFATQWKGTLVPMNDHSDKEAVLYTDPETNKDYRFILHRKNHQKADNYACARCKSRKKYVRILIAGEYFLEDPAKLEHICYLDAEELRKARENIDQKKSMELIKERQNRVKKQRVRQASDPMLDLAMIKNEPGVYPFNAIASLFEDGAPADIGVGSPISGDEEVDPDQPTTATASLLDTVFNQTIKVEQEDRKDLDLQRSDPEPKEPFIKRPRSESFGVFSGSQPERDDGSFHISLRRALSGLKPECRSKAENEILRFVYSKLYEKYAT